MQNEKELRAQAQQLLGKELSDDDLEKIAGGYDGNELGSMYITYREVFKANHPNEKPMSIEEWLYSNGYL